MAEQNDMLTADMNLFETESSISISVIREMFESLACNCRDSVHAYFWLKRLKELDDEKLLKWYNKFVPCKKNNEWMLSVLGLERFDMFCAILSK